MSIEIPDITRQPLAKWLSVCAHVKTTDKNIIDLFSHDSGYISPVLIDGKKMFVRALFGKNSHFHVDVMLPGTFKETEAKKVAYTRLRTELNVLVGQNVEFFGEGTFHLSVAELPSNFGRLLDPTKVNDITVTMRNGSYYVEGAPVAYVSWGRLADGAIWIELKTMNRSTIVSKSYLTDVWKLISFTFSEFFSVSASDD